MELNSGHPENLIESLKQLKSLSPALRTSDLNKEGWFTRKQASEELRRSDEWASVYLKKLVAEGKAEQCQAIGRNGQSQVMWRLK